LKFLKNILPQEPEYDRPSIGATSGSPPMPSLEPEEHQTFTTPGAFELGNSQRLTNVNNNVDHLKRRIDLLDEVVRNLLKEQDYNDGDLSKWFIEQKEKLAKAH
jgi:hypothetical protein